jgi:hypothetical protein
LQWLVEACRGPRLPQATESRQRRIIGDSEKLRWYQSGSVKWSLVAPAFALVVLFTMSARAQIVLAWKAPPECPQGDEVRERLVALTGTSLDQATLRADAEVTRRDGQFRLRLRVVDGEEVRERVIESNSCSDLAGAAAVALVFLLQDETAPSEPDPSGSSQGGPDEGHTAPDPTSTVAETTPPANPLDYPSESNLDPVDAPGRPPRRWDLLIRAPIGVFDLGPLPKPAGGLGVGAGVRYDAYRVVVSAEWFPSQNVASESADANAVVQRATGLVAVCRGWTSGRLELSPCVALALEHVEARGAGAEVESQSDGVFWLAPGAEVTLHLHLQDWLAVFAGASGRIEAARPRLVVEGLGELRQLAPFGAGALLGVEWIL